MATSRRSASARARLEAHMRRALRLARGATGATYPNPCVGAVVARGERVLGAARSGPTGQAHAEVRALRKAGAAAKGADLFVTLEPCCHTGRTPPCTEAIEAAGIRRVFVSVLDPAGPMRGKGIERLRGAGIPTEVGLLGDVGASVHAHYLHHVRTGRPFVTLKVATSLDGYIATQSGHSQWISGEAARKHAHRLRARHHAIAVGAETVRSDDPRLTVRLARGVDPLPVIFDTRLSLFETEHAFALLRPGTWIIHTRAAPAAARRRAEALGLTRLEVRSRGGHVDLASALEALGAREIRSLMVEGGGRLLGGMLAAGGVQELHWVRAPIVLGEGRPAFAGVRFERVTDAPRLTEIAQKRLGEDLLTVFRV